MRIKHTKEMILRQASDIGQAVKIYIVAQIGVNEIDDSVNPMALDGFSGLGG